jgi:hypothetical protein
MSGNGSDPARSDRRDIALSIIDACVGRLGDIDADDPLHQEAQSLQGELEDASSEAEACEFPGMYR